MLVELLEVSPSKIALQQIPCFDLFECADLYAQQAVQFAPWIGNQMSSNFMFDWTHVTCWDF